MAAHTQLSPEEYLRTSFDGADREFLDGEIVERNVGENRHSRAQHRLDCRFGDLSKKLPFYVRPEMRIQIAPRRYRVADLAVYAGKEPVEEVPSDPPLVTIEIVSRDDRYTEVLAKLEEYRQRGVKYIWLVDPWMLKIYVYGAAGLLEVEAFQVPEYSVEIPAAEVLG